MIICESILDTVKARVIICGHWGYSKNWLKPKPPEANLLKLSLSKPMKLFVI